jgi:hypothetical protein
MAVLGTANSDCKNSINCVHRDDCMIGTPELNEETLSNIEQFLIYATLLYKEFDLTADWLPVRFRKMLTNKGVEESDYFVAEATVRNQYTLFEL